MRIKPEQIRAWVSRNFPDFKQRKGGQCLRINNPLTADDDYHFEINLDGGGCHDWRGDGWVGINSTTGERNKCTFLRFVQLYLTKKHGYCSFTLALRDICGATATFADLRDSREEVQEGPPEPSEDHIELPAGSQPLWQSKEPKTAGCLFGWLASRGITSDKVSKYRMHHIGVEILWPYYQFEELVYYQSRTCVAKRFNYPVGSTGKGHFLFGFDNIEPASHLVVTEAIIDCQTIEEQCVATGGAGLTAHQIALIRMLGPKDGIILAPDNDAAGIKSILGDASKLRDSFPLYYSLPPEITYTEDSKEKTTKDWNDVGKVLGWGRPVQEQLETGVRRLDIKARLHLAALAAKKERVAKQPLNGRQS